MNKNIITLFLCFGFFINLNAETDIKQNSFFNELLTEEKTQEKENRMFIELVNNFKDILTENINLTNEKLKLNLKLENKNLDVKKLKNIINEKDIQIKILKSNLKNAEINMELNKKLIINKINSKKEIQNNKELENKKLTILQLKNKLKIFKENYKKDTGKNWNKNFQICEVKKKAINLRKEDNINSPIIRKHYKGDLLKIRSIEKNWIRTNKGYVFKTLCKIL
jgi:hypothetical protein